MLDRLKKIWTLGWMDIALIEIEIAGYTIEIAFGEPVPNTAELRADVTIDVTPEAELPAALEGEVVDAVLEDAIGTVTANDMAEAVAERKSSCIYLNEPTALYSAIQQKPMVVQLGERMHAQYGNEYAAPMLATLERAFQETNWVMSFVPKPGEHAVEAKRFRLKTHELLVMIDGLNLLTHAMEDDIVAKAIALAEPEPVVAAPTMEGTPKKRLQRTSSYPNRNERRSHRQSKKAKTIVRQAFLKVDLGRAHLTIQPDS